MRPFFLDHPQNLYAVNIRHLKVCQHKVIRLACKHLQAVFTAPDSLHIVTLGCKRTLAAHQDYIFVIYYKYLIFAHVLPS